MAYAVIIVVSLAVSLLTVFSAFGLGTLLLPAFALFFPVPVAVAATAVVHLANNLFRAGLLARHADWPVVLRFAAPGAAAAILGALLLQAVAGMPPLFTYQLFGQTRTVTAVRLVIAVLIIFFSLFELLPRLQHLRFDRKYVIPGGILSGFFGGLSGHQGALRSAFLINIGLSKEAFVGSSVISAVIVDVARLLVYGLTFYSQHFKSVSGEALGLVAAGCAAAFAGSFVGARLLPKITLRTVQLIVGVMLVFIGVLMALGLA